MLYTFDMVHCHICKKPFRVTDTEAKDIYLGYKKVKCHYCGAIVDDVIVNNLYYKYCISALEKRRLEKEYQQKCQEKAGEYNRLNYKEN